MYVGGGIETGVCSVSRLQKMISIHAAPRASLADIRADPLSVTQTNVVTRPVTPNAARRVQVDESVTRSQRQAKGPATRRRLRLAFCKATKITLAILLDLWHEGGWPFSRSSVFATEQFASQITRPIFAETVTRPTARKRDRLHLLASRKKQAVDKHYHGQSLVFCRQPS